MNDSAAENADLRRRLAEAEEALATDLSERKAHEEKLRQLNLELEERVRARTAELREREERFRVAQELSPDGFTVLRPVRDAAGRVVDFTWVYENAPIARLNGTDPKAVLGRRLLEAFPGHRGSSFLEAYTHVAETGETRVLEASYQGDSIPELTWFRVAVVRMGLDIGILAQDITEQKRTQKALRESEERLRVLGDNLPNSMVYQYSYDPDGTPRFLYISAGVEHLNGVKPEEVLKDAGVLHRQFLPEELPGMLEKERLSARDLSVFEHEALMRLPSGEVRWMHMRSRPRRLPDGRVIWDGVQTDVTQRKQSDETLQQSQQKLSLALRSAAMGAWRLDLRTHQRDFDEQVCRYLGLDPSRFGGTAEEFYAAVHPEDRAALEAALDLTVTTGAPYQVEYRTVWPDGSQHYVAARGQLARDAAGQPERIDGLLWDITEHKQAEAALRESEAKYRNLFESIQEMVAVYAVERDSEGRIVERRLRDANPAFLRAAGVLSIEQLRGKTSAEVFGRSWSELHLPIIQRAMATAQMQAQEAYREESGRHYITTVVPLDASTYLGTAWDITKRKQAEAELRQSEERYRFLIQSLPVPLGVVSRNGRSLFFNDRFTQVFGYSLADLPTLEAWWLRAYPDPAYRRQVMENWQAKMQRSGQSQNGTEPEELNVTCKDGSVRVALISNLVIGDCILASFIDITERKQAEAALRESHERMKKVLEVETVGMMFWDLNTGCMTDSNDAFLKLMGYSRHEVEARELTWQKLTPPEYIEASQAEIRKFLATGRVGPYEKEYFRKDGTRQWLIFAGSSLGNNACVEFCVDISAQKKAEEAVRQQATKLQGANDELTRFNEVMVGRELRMIELKREINQFCAQLGQPSRYPQADKI